MVQRIATDDGERSVLDDIAKYGWHCIYILEQDGQPPWTFTIGLFETWKHPELVIFGLKRQVAHEILNIVAVKLAKGERIDLSQPTDDLVHGASCLLVGVPEHHYRARFGFARWYYQGDGFPVYQIVWPNREGYFLPFWVERQSA